MLCSLLPHHSLFCFPLSVERSTLVKSFLNPLPMFRRISSRVSGVLAASAATQTRQMHFPISAPPVEIEYLDSDPLEYAVRTEARKWGFDDFQYMRELAFVRIKENPTVGQFREMTPDQRRDMFWGSDRQDFFRQLTFAVTGQPEHLYHRGW
ncbi:cytochrome c oxidase subunit 10 [Strigomonas culicis]|uniref:Cytochrome c oxidase subunit 10 n=1 Tax=Strigomonas culicis TaxID=28005 RepID=S9UZQ1_9TRYP|nr:cytochrome c oxidase subunit 10 [Strigomonas culicis]|eukprot:EPY34234.1 cytochrome c oxidase subunit 10 [Strigomonas culicis]